MTSVKAVKPYNVALAAVKKKLGGVTSEAVRQRRARLQKLVVMPNDVALYVLAHQLGLPVHRWLRDEPDTMREVSAYAAQMGGQAEPPVARPAAKATRGKQAVLLSEIRLDGIGVPARLQNARHQAEAVRMSTEVYPLLYVFENSVREYVDGHLTAAYGAGWCDDPKYVLVSKPVRDAVAVARKAEAENRYHTGRNARPVYYTTLGHLSLIVNSNDGWKVFKPPRFPRPTWFPELIQSAEVSRNVVAHMNPLQPKDVRALRMSVEHWFKQIAGDAPPSVP